MRCGGDGGGLFGPNNGLFRKIWILLKCGVAFARCGGCGNGIG